MGNPCFWGKKTQRTSNVTNEVQTIPDDSVVSGWTQIKFKTAGNNGMSISNVKKQPEYYVCKNCLMLSCEYNWRFQGWQFWVLLLLLDEP